MGRPQGSQVDSWPVPLRPHRLQAFGLSSQGSLLAYECQRPSSTFLSSCFSETSAECALQRGGWGTPVEAQCWGYSLTPFPAARSLCSEGEDTENP